MLTYETLLEIITTHDPMYLMFLGVSEDEYSREARLIFYWSTQCSTLSVLQLAIFTAFSDSFGKSAGHIDDYGELAKEIWEHL